MPRSPTIVSYRAGKLFISPEMLAISAASNMWSSTASGTPKAMFSRSVSLKRKVSCGTYPIARRRRGERILANRAAIEKQRSGGRLPQTRDQCGERGFPAARGADDGQRGTGRNVQADIAQDGHSGCSILGRRVREGHMLELNFAANSGFGRCLCGIAIARGNAACGNGGPCVAAAAGASAMLGSAVSM